MSYYFVFDCHSNTKNTFGKFHKTYQTFFKKQRKIMKMYPPSKKKTQNQFQAKRNTPIKIFSPTTIRVLSRIYVHIFRRNQTVPKKQRKTSQVGLKNTVKWPPGEELL